MAVSRIVKNPRPGSCAKVVEYRSNFDKCYFVLEGYFCILDLHSNICEHNNGGCSHMCLRHNGGRTCVCPDGIKQIDTRTCQGKLDILL